MGDNLDYHSDGGLRKPITVKQNSFGFVRITIAWNRLSGASTMCGTPSLQRLSFKAGLPPGALAPVVHAMQSPSPPPPPTHHTVVSCANATMRPRMTASYQRNIVEVLLYVHRNRRFIRDGSPGRPPRLSRNET